MIPCAEDIGNYALRSVGIGERLLPRSDFTLCNQVTLIGSGMIWNLYFAAMALFFGFFLANALAVAKASRSPWARKPAEGFVFLFRGSPLFIQFFLAYQALVMLPRAGIEVMGFTVATSWLTKAWAGALLVLILNTSAYSAQIFHGALMSVPKGDLEAADAYGLTGWAKFRRVTWPTMMRLAWPSYTNEAIFLFQATALVFFSGFPAFRLFGSGFAAFRLRPPPRPEARGRKAGGPALRHWAPALRRSGVPAFRRRASSRAAIRACPSVA